jgi:hypothetical protein
MKKSKLRQGDSLSPPSKGSDKSAANPKVDIRRVIGSIAAICAIIGFLLTYIIFSKIENDGLKHENDR